MLLQSSKLTFYSDLFVLNAGHCLGDPFKVPPSLLQKANLIAIDWAFKHWDCEF